MAVQQTSLAGKRSTIIVHLGFWLILLLFPIAFGLQQADLGFTLRRLSIPFLVLMAVTYFNLFILVPKLFKQRKYALYALGVLVSILASARGNRWWFGMHATEEYLSRPIPGSDLTFGELPSQLQFLPPMLLTLMVLFISTVYALARNQIKEEKAAAILQTEKTSAELKFLRSQINPHFFFNALNNLYSLIKLQPEKTDEFIRELEEMLRYVIYDCAKERINLTKEIKAVESYIFFQKIRDPEKIKVTFERNISFESLQLEPMIIIPLVENAFKHGYSPGGEVLNVFINISGSDKELELEITNSLPEAESKPNHTPSDTGVGLTNIKQRLEYCYGENHQIDTSRTEDVYSVRLTIKHG